MDTQIEEINAATSTNNSINYRERRTHHRYQTSTPEKFIVQRAWSHFVQVYLYSDHLIIGEIIDISLGGLACRVAYEFDLIDPIEIDVVISLKSGESEGNYFKPVTIPAIIMRAKQMDSNDTCELGIKFLAQNDKIKAKITQLISQIN